MTITIHVWQEGDWWSTASSTSELWTHDRHRSSALHFRKSLELRAQAEKPFNIPDEIRFVVVEGRP